LRNADDRPGVTYVLYKRLLAFRCGCVAGLAAG